MFIFKQALKEIQNKVWNYLTHAHKPMLSTNSLLAGRVVTFQSNPIFEIYRNSYLVAK